MCFISSVAQRLVDEMAQGMHSPAFRSSGTADTSDSWLTVDDTSAKVTEQVL